MKTLKLTLFTFSVLLLASCSNVQYSWLYKPDTSKERVVQNKESRADEIKAGSVELVNANDNSAEVNPDQEIVSTTNSADFNDEMTSDASGIYQSTATPVSGNDNPARTSDITDNILKTKPLMRRALKKYAQKIEPADTSHSQDDISTLIYIILVIIIILIVFSLIRDILSLNIVGLLALILAILIVGLLLGWW